MNKEIIVALIDAIDLLNQNLWIYQGIDPAKSVTEKLKVAIELLNNEDSEDEN